MYAAEQKKDGKISFLSGIFSAHFFQLLIIYYRFTASEFNKQQMSVKYKNVMLPYYIFTKSYIFYS